MGSFSGLKIINTVTNIRAVDLINGKFTIGYDSYKPFFVSGFAMLIRGNTFNAFDGRGGPDGNSACNTYTENQRPLGSDSCSADGVGLYPIICKANSGFTYNGVYFACPPI